MNVPANNSVINESLPLSKNIKLENEQENTGEIISIFLPDHMTETDTSHTTAEPQVDLVRVKEEPFDIINGDIPEDPLAIEETTLVKSENLIVESEVVTIDEGFTKGSTTKNYICNVCQKSFNRKYSLKRHFINSHTKEGNYICNFCQKTFYQSHALKLHLNIHTKENNYVCNFCQKSFNNKNNLRRHINSHTKEKNYILFGCKRCHPQSYCKKYWYPTQSICQNFWDQD
ncbi:uncharacterized protein LOC142334021 [Lycorma delicatula]|uniref:uncharacterized protein LOC142334021 n=1 Tax=Lycorma delicatula TaxID=130591 RepID=UPI003F5125A4